MLKISGDEAEATGICANLNLVRRSKQLGDSIDMKNRAIATIFDDFFDRETTIDLTNTVDEIPEAEESINPEEFYDELAGAQNKFKKIVNKHLLLYSTLHTHNRNIAQLRTHCNGAMQSIVSII